LNNTLLKAEIDFILADVAKIIGMLQKEWRKQHGLHEV